MEKTVLKTASPMVSIESNIGRRIQTIRMLRNMSQASLARRFERLEVPVSRQMVANYECGRNNVPAHFIPAIAHVLGVSITELLPPLAEAAVQSIKVRNDNSDSANGPVANESINAKPPSDRQLIRHLPMDDLRNLSGPKIRLLRKERKWTQCHRSLQNQPAGVESKPATLR